MSHAIRFGSNNSIGDKPCAVAKELIVHRHGIMRSPGIPRTLAFCLWFPFTFLRFPFSFLAPKMNDGNRGRYSREYRMSSTRLLNSDGRVWSEQWHFGIFGLESWSDAVNPIESDTLPYLTGSNTTCQIFVD